MNKLNKEQIAAVQDIKGPAVVISGAGTGKSTVIAAKIAHLQETARPHGILAISFTRKAVADLKLRLANDRGVTVCTFHSFFYRILRNNGYRSFTFLTDSDRKAVVKNAIKKAGLTEKLTPEAVIESLAKGEFKGDTAKAVAVYMDILKELRLLDFDVLQHFCLELLDANTAVVKAVRSSYEYVLIDEGQDISKIQLSIIKKLWSKTANLTVVGDPRQSIYSFRGSYGTVMDDIISHYKPQIYNLTTNYRCDPSILNLANKVLPNGAQLTAAKKANGCKPVFCTAKTAKDEAKSVADTIKGMYANGTKLNDIAILYRSIPAVTAVCKQLLSSSIPFVKVGASCDVWVHNPYKQVLAALNYVQDMDNPKSLKYCAQLLSIPEDVVEEVEESKLQYPEMPLTDIIVSMPMLPQSTKDKVLSLKASAHNIQNAPLRDAVIAVWSLVVRDYLKADDDDLLEQIFAEIEDYQSIDELKTSIINTRKQYRTMEKLIASKTADFVRVMSIHSAKGLEWENVFLVGCTDGILPDTSHEGVDISEENRLAYVAATRAKERLFISYPQENNKSKEPNKPSRFFQDGFNFGQNKMAATMVAEKKETI